VSFLDALLGRSKPKPAKLDALFAISGAAVGLEAALGLRPTGRAGVCFKPASGMGFESASQELRQLLDLAVREGGGKLEISDDRYGYRWVVLDDPDLEDLVTSVHLVNATLEERGFGPLLLCSVFAFGKGERACHLVYLYKRGTFYPFAPGAGQRRDNELELQVRGAVAEDLPVEPDLTRWMALWGLPLA
jgi:hypothetical protein